MKKVLLLFFTLVISLNSIAQDKDLKLWYDKQANEWSEALPLGNGKLGAMVYGNPLKENYQLNDGTLWSGYPQDITNPKAKVKLPEIRDAINRGEFKEAAELWMDNAQGPYTARYLPMGDLALNMIADGKPTNIYRDLNISNATSVVQFKQNGTNYSRTTFISHPDQLMVIKLDADKKQALNFELELGSQLRFEVKSEGKDLVLRGKAPKYVPFGPSEANKVAYDANWDGLGLNFEVRLKVIIEDGNQFFNKDNKLIVNGASKATILLSAATDYDGFNIPTQQSTKNPVLINKTNITAASNKTYDDLLKRHIEDYKQLFDRVSVKIGDEAKVDYTVTIDQRLKNFSKSGLDNDLLSLMYQYGRYLMISSSRQGSLPSNLQGIWNNNVIPPWGSNYTLDINTEMNYWLTETTNLAECHEPLLDFIKTLSISGAETANKNYGMKGWVSHQNSDAWAQTVPQGDFDRDKLVRAARWTCWPMSGAWFCRHLWEHYLFNKDKTYLKEKAYPIMKGSAEFMLDWLTEDAETGYLVTNPSTSPENRFYYYDNNGKKQIGDISKASTMDLMLIWDLFSMCIEASDVLNIDKDFKDKLIKIKSRLHPLQLGKRGQLQEWYKDYDDVELKHRHVSHLYGLYPGLQIQVRRTPDLAAAAKKSLDIRGNNDAVWVAAWKTCLWARLEDGEKAYESIRNGFRFIDPMEKKQGGVYGSLLTAYPPFQIDGNFGLVAGLTEMIIQSHAGELHLLPAIPASMQSGEIKGLKARGGFEVDLKWNNGLVESVVIHSLIGGDCIVRSKGKLVSNKKMKLSAINESSLNQISETKFLKNSYEDKLEKIILGKTNLYLLKTEKGKSYELVLK